MFDRFFARQLAQPSGWFGRWFMARWFRRHTGGVNRLAMERMDPRPGDRVLEIGFGGGDLLLRLAASGQCACLTGIDRSEDMVQRLRRRLRPGRGRGEVRLACASVEAMPFPAGHFTQVISVNTLYFWTDPALALAECRRVLAPGGRLTLCFDAKADLERWPGHVFGFRLYEPEEVLALIGAAGFEEADLVTRAMPGYGSVHCLCARGA